MSRAILGSFTLFVALFVATPSRAAKDLPPPPKHHVHDEAGAISQDTFRSLSTVLYEHEQATGEQFVVAVFKSLEREELVDWTNQLFAHWKIGKRAVDSGVLLALYWEDRKARFEVGYGLEPLMTDARSKSVLEDTLLPELKAGRPDRALTLTALEVLTTLESPLVKNGRAQAILQGGVQGGDLAPRSTTGGSFGIWLFLGIVLLMIVLNMLTAADAHYTSHGWYRPRPFPRRRRGGGIFWGGLGGGLGGGGFGGGGGGFGGFGGFGGGRSGGGGASGSW